MYVLCCSQNQPVCNWFSLFLFLPLRATLTIFLFVLEEFWCCMLGTLGSQTHWSLYDIGLISLYQNSRYISALRFQHITMLKLLQQSCHFNFSHFFICLLFWQSYMTTHSNSNTVKKYEKVQYQNCQTSCHTKFTLK